MPNYRVSLNLTKLDKSAFIKGKNGTYVNLTLWENETEDQFGNSHSIKQDMGKDRRGEKTPYVGNAKTFGAGSTPKQNARPPAGNQSVSNDDTDIPY